MVAHRMVLSTQDALKNINRDFESVKIAADNFFKWANAELMSDEECELEVEETLPEKQKRKKMMPGEMASDESFIDANSAYEAGVHNQSIHQCFLTHGSLYADLAILNPRNFPKVSSSGLPDSTFQELRKCLLKFDNRANPAHLQSELKCLAVQFPRLKQSVLEEYKIRTAEDNSGVWVEGEIQNSSCKACKNCPTCCYQLLTRYNLLTP